MHVTNLTNQIRKRAYNNNAICHIYKYPLSFVITSSGYANLRMSLSPDNVFN